MLKNIQNIIEKSRLFAISKTSRKLPHGIVIVVLAIVFSIGSKLIGTLATKLPFLASLELNKTVSFFMILVVMYAGYYYLPALWMKFYEKRSFFTVGLEWKYSPLYKIIRGIVMSLLMMGSVVGVLSLLGYVHINDSIDASPLTFLLPSLLLLVGWMVQGTAEEVLSRGWLLQSLATRHNRYTAIVIVPFFFVALHFLSGIPDFISILNLFIISLFFIFYALREGSLWGVAAFHSVWNWSQGSVFGFDVSGNNVGNSIFHFVSTGPKYISGGEYGLEGGIVVTIFSLIALSIVLFYPFKENNKFTS